MPYKIVLLRHSLVVSLLFLSLQAVGAKVDSHLKDFKTDYCTYFPEGTIESPELWKSCCFDHDLRYWFGGTEGDMLLADERLRSCVSAKAGSFYGNLMFYGVRAGHFSPIKNQYKWSWGWSVEREKLPLTSIEKMEINRKIDELARELDLDKEYIKAFREYYLL